MQKTLLKRVQNYHHLLSLSHQNKKHMDTIESSLFAVALDTLEDLPLGQTPYDRGSMHDSHIRHIRSGKSANNRWLDKGFTLMFMPDGKCGMSGEHSSCDALAPSMLGDEALKEPVNLRFLQEQDGGYIPRLEVMEWETDEYLEKQCLSATESAFTLIEDSDYSLLWFDGFGTSWMSEGKFIYIAVTRV
jgi:hypothetical protein